MRFSLGCELHYRIRQATTFILNVEAQGGAQQQVLTEGFEITPFVATEPQRAAQTANLYRRFVMAPGDYTIRYEAQVALSPQLHDPDSVAEVPISDLPLDVLPYLYASRFCQSDKLARFAWRQFGSLPRGHQRVAGICNWIFDNVDYLAGSSDAVTSAYDTFTLRAGVCRDFAHLGITFCRALGIPARFVSAYGWQLQPPDFHAVFEAYLSGRWYLFDATRLCPIDAIVRIATGRDAADTAFATYYGDIEDAPKLVWIDAMDSADANAEWTTAAVSATES